MSEEKEMSLRSQKTPREQSKNISTGKSKPHFIGPKSAQVIIQEIWSLKNQKDAFRKPTYKAELDYLKAKLRSLYGQRYSDELWRQIFK